MSRIQVSYTRDEPTPPNLFTDHDWFRANQDELLKQYGEGFVVVFQESVLGIGETYEAALAAAESNLPPGDDRITPIVELLRQRHPFYRVRPES